MSTITPHAGYATHLRMLGLPERDVLLRHVLPNGCAPAVQQLARTVDGDDAASRR